PTPTTEQPATVGDYVGAYVGALNRGVSTLASGSLKFLGAIDKTLGPTGGDEVSKELAKRYGSGLYELGEKLEKFTEDVNPRYENVSQFGQDVAEGVGQAAGMMVTAGGSAISQGLQQTGKLSTNLFAASGRALKDVGERVATPVGFLGGSI